MNTRNDRILEWAKKKVQLEYSNDISLLVVYGSYINHTEDYLSDVDFYFIPENEKAYTLGSTFIIEGIGYDLFPMKWERVEGLAILHESLTSLLGNSKIVYARSDTDEKRFEKLQGALRANLSNPVFMHRKAVEKFGQAVHSWSNLQVQSDTCDCRLSAGDIILHLADAVAYENLMYFKNGLKTLFIDLKTMTRLPVGFIVNLEAILKANNIIQIKEECGRLIESCKIFLNSDIKSPIELPQTEKPIKQSRDTNYLQLAELYGEIISTFNKVYKYCKNGDYILAFISAIGLQHALNEDTQGLKFDVLSDYDAADLSRLSASTKGVEEYLVNFISRGAVIRKYTCIDEFLKEN